MTARTRFELVDAMRGLAALSVLVYHVTIFYGAPGTVVGFLTFFYTGEPHPAVVVFFLISGFVLYRPFAAARLRGTAPPPLLAYAVRRLARIVPGYWLALTVAAVMLDLHYVFTASGVVRYYGFLQLYQPFFPTRGIAPAWTLCVEVTFYAVLPLLALAVRRFTSAMSFLKGELLLCGALWICSIAWQLVMFHQKEWWELSLLYVLPGTVGLFATGMALAAVSLDLDARTRSPRWISIVERFPWASWVLGFGLLYLAGRNVHLETSNFGLWWLRNEALKVLGALLLLLPLVFGAERRDPMRRILRTRPLLFLGTISYGVYLWHAPLLLRLKSHLVPRGQLFADVGLAVLTVLAASVSFYLVERPVQRLARSWLARRVGPRSATPISPTPAGE